MQRLRWAGGALLDRGLRSPSMWRSSALAAASALRLEVLGVRHLIQLGLISITSRARSCAICCSDVLCRRWLQRASRSSSDHGLPALIVGKPSWLPRHAPTAVCAGGPSSRARPVHWRGAQPSPAHPRDDVVFLKRDFGPRSGRIRVFWAQSDVLLHLGRSSG
jgi:hypothetical protein